jgi:hypothetical protein
MPYIIYMPGCPRPYITNDPRIYIDAKECFKWPSESRPYADAECKMIRKEEGERFEGERRAARLEQYWLEELARCNKSVETGPTKIMESTTKHEKNDLVYNVVVEVKELEPRGDLLA